MVDESAGGRFFFAALAALSLASFASGPASFAALAYHRSAILQGEAWRLLTTHVVHANSNHLLWNLGATAVVAAAVARALSIKVWMVAGLAVALGSAAGVLLLQPHVRVMSGLSALLHGLLAAGAAAQVRRGERLGWSFLGLIAAKVAWEQFGGPTPVTRVFLTAEIAVGAHAYGAVAGLLAGCVLPVEARPALRAASTGSDVA